MIKYHLVENHLTERAEDYTAQVQGIQSFDKNALVERMLQKGTLLTKTDIVAVLNGLEETVIDILREGGSITLPLFHTGFSISGVFEGAMDSFDANRHSIHVNVARGSLLRDLQSELKAEKESAPAPSNTIIEVKDSVSGKVNESLTAGGVAELFGTGIKISGDGASNGVYFVKDDGTKVKVTTIVQNNPSNLIVVVPVLEAGTYTTEVITQYTGSGTVLKTQRSIVFNHPLTVKA